MRKDIGTEFYTAATGEVEESPSPAAVCDLVGMKETHKVVLKTGSDQSKSSLDQLCFKALLKGEAQRADSEDIPVHTCVPILITVLWWLMVTCVGEWEAKGKSTTTFHWSSIEFSLVRCNVQNAGLWRLGFNSVCRKS